MANQIKNTVGQIKFVVATAFALSLVLVFAIDEPLAQDSNNDDLLTCDAIEDERDRLKCFNDIVNALRRQMDGQPTVRPQAGNGEGQEQGSVATSSGGLENFGFADPERGKITLVSGVTRFWYTTYDKKLVLELTNGQIWMETKSSSYRARPRERAVDPHTLTVEIKEGRIGGYRLKIQGKKGFARVRRLR